jgi:MltA specific insert domain
MNLIITESMKQLLASLSLVLILTACAGDATKLTPTTYSALDGWGSDNHAAALAVFADSCAVNAKRSAAYVSKSEGPIGVRENWQHVCRVAGEALPTTDEAARQFFESNFTPYKVETESKATSLHCSGVRASAWHPI